MVEEKTTLRRKRIAYYWMSFLSSYVFPMTYFGVKLGVTKEGAKIMLPLIIIGLIGVVKIAMDLPKWVSTWSPGIWKGLVLMIPILVIFIILMTLGVGLQYILAREIEVDMFPYYETVVVLFGGHTVGGILNAVHLKYRDLELMSKGYVLGVVNK